MIKDSEAKLKSVTEIILDTDIKLNKYCYCNIAPQPPTGKPGIAINVSLRFTIPFILTKKDLLNPKFNNKKLLKEYCAAMLDETQTRFYLEKQRLK